MNFLSRISKAIGGIADNIAKVFSRPASPSGEATDIQRPEEPIESRYDFGPREVDLAVDDIDDFEKSGEDISDPRYGGMASIAEFDRGSLRPVQAAYLSDVVNYYGDIPVPVEFYLDPATDLFFVVVGES
jgi:hypothetical protein